MKSVADRKAALDARRADLLARIADIEAEFDAHEAKDWQEMAVERESDEVLQDLGESARQELRMIDAALGRIDDGSYGECVTCGAAITEERLDLLPATPFCRDCAAKS